MAALKKGVALSLGLVTASVSVNGALEPKVGNKQACDGVTGKPAHDLTLITQVNRCTHCGDVPYAEIVKAREVPGGLVPLDDAEIVAAKGGEAAIKAATVTMAIAPHPAAEVEVTMVSGKALYYLTPDPGHEVPYAVLRHTIREHPELAFLVQWTPRSAASTYRLSVFGDCIVAAERVRPGKLRPAPIVPATAPPAMLALIEQVLALPGVVTDFNPDTYLDTYEDRIQALVASKQVVPTGTAPAGPAVPAVPAGQQAAMDQLAAMLAAAGQQVDTTTGEVSPAAPKAPRKRAAKVKTPA